MSKRAEQFDILAVGGGAAGLVTAAGAAGLGARAALMERSRMGGECLWTGCIPSKALIAAARAAASVREAGRFGVRAQLNGIDFAAVMNHVRSVQERIAPHDSPERFRGLGVEVVQGSARFLDERTVEVAGHRYAARHIVIATGSRPLIPEIAGLDQVAYHTNETIFELTELPASLIVLGGGPIGIELAQAFARLGTVTTVIEAAPRALAREDQEIAQIVLSNVAQSGVRIKAGLAATSFRTADAGIEATLSDGSIVTGSVLLVAAGRVSNYQDLDLARAGVATDQHGLILDDRLSTTTPGIWAAGDVTGAPRFTHVADYQARLVLRNALFPFSTRASYAGVPWVTYTDPELAHLGLTETEARERHGDSVRVWRRSFDSLDRAVADGKTSGMVKLIANEGGRLLGAHVAGEAASSLIGELALAMKNQLSLARIAATIHSYPTYAEAIKHAAEQPAKARLTGFTQSLVRWLVSERHR